MRCGVEDGFLVIREDPEGLLRRERLPVRVARVVRQVGVGVGDGEDARQHRDLLAGGAAGEALAVVALVHRVDRGHGVVGQLGGLEEARRREHRLLRGGAVTVVLGHVERRQVVAAHLAEVVDLRGDGRRLRGARIETDALREPLAQARHQRRVPAQVLPRVLDEAHHDAEDLERRLARHLAAHGRRPAGRRSRPAPTA